MLDPTNIKNNVTENGILEEKSYGTATRSGVS